LFILLQTRIILTVSYL